MRRSSRLAVQLLVSGIALAGLAPTSASAETLVVDSTGDAGDAFLLDGRCDDGSGFCTLRAAIEQANFATSADLIEFDIPGGGPHVISTAGADGYQITSPLEIDGTSQLPGWSPNTLAAGSNAVLPIEIDGGGADSDGLRVNAPGVVLRGLVIRSFRGACVIFDSFASGSRLLGSRIEGCSFGVFVQSRLFSHIAVGGIRIGGTALDARNVINGESDGIGLQDSNGNFVVNNVIGLDPTGTLRGSMAGACVRILYGSGNTLTDNVISNCIDGVLLQDSSSNTLTRNRIGTNAAGTAERGNRFGVHLEGGTANRIGLPSATLASANLISGNFDRGIWIEGGGENRVQGNRIGTRLGPLLGLGNNREGVLIDFSSGNTIGAGPTGDVAGEGNEIAFNRYGGVVIGLHPFDFTSIDNSVRGNRIWGNRGSTSDDPRLSEIDLGSDGPRNRDICGDPGPDCDEGPNHIQNAPQIDAVTASQGRTEISGKIAALAGLYTLDFYSSVVCDGGRGQFYLGRSLVYATPTGAGSDAFTEFAADLPVTAQGQFFTATATDSNGNTSEFSFCFEVPIAGGADLALDIDHFLSNADPGEAVVLTVALANRGPFEATGVPVRVARPAGFASWAAVPSQGGYDEATGLWSLGTLANGATASLVITAVVDPAQIGTIDVDVTAVEGLSQLDPNLFDNSDRAHLRVRSGADLALSMTGPPSADLGELVRFDLTIANTGPEPALGVTLSGQLEEGLEFVGGPPPPFAFDLATRRWAYPIGDLAEDVSATLRIDARVAEEASLGTALTHSVAAIAANPVDPTDNFVTTLVAVGTAADLSIFMAKEFTADDSVRVRDLTVTNHGPGAVEGFRLVVDSCGGNKLRVTGYDFVPSPSCVSSPPGVSSPIEEGTCPLVCDVSLRVEAGATQTDFGAIRYLTRGSEPQFTARIESSPDAPFYDPDRSNDSVAAVDGGVAGPCGLIGVEPLILVAWLLARRRARRGFGRAASLLLLLLGGLCLAPAPARALPIVFTVDGAASSASVAITSPVATPPVALALSGTLQAEVALVVDPLFGLVADSLLLTGAALAFSDAALLLDDPPLSTLTFTGAGVVASLSGPPANGFAVGPGRSLFDLFGSVLLFDAGTIAATGTHFGVPVDLTLDLALASISSVFPVNSVAQTRVTDLGGGAATLRLSLPFSAPVNIAVDDTVTTVTFAGQLVLNGTVVPEPSTAALLVFALAALTATHARRRSSGRHV